MKNWRKYEFGEVVTLSKEKYNPKKEKDNFICIELEHLESDTGRLLGHTDSITQQSVKNKFKPGSVLFGKLRPYLKKFHLPNFHGVCSSEIWVLEGNEGKLRNEYLYCLVQSNKFTQNANKSAGSKMPRADWNYVSEIIFTVPPIEEQQKIASILSIWDKAIELKEKLIVQKKEQKKGLMQKLLTGEVRLLGFEGEWEKVKLGDICNITTGKLDANAMQNNGRYKFFTCAKEVYSIDDYAFETEALLVSGNGANVGYIHYYNGKFNAYQRTYVLDEFSNNIMFVKYLLDKDLQRRIHKEKNAGNTPYITLSTLSDMSLLLPSKDEQDEIANVLKKSDHEIELLEKEIEYHKNQKKGLMQLLLTGKVRVKV